MSIKKRIVPFSAMPGSWGLSGKTRKIAEAEYYFDGYDLDLALCDINYEGYDAQVEKLKVDLNHKKLSQYEYDLKLAELKTKTDLDLSLNEISEIIIDEKLTNDVADKRIAEIKAAFEVKSLISKLDIELLHSKISKVDYDKKVAEITGSPWVSIPKINWDPNNSNQTYFELDYNQAFVADLRNNGYMGTEEEIIDKWLNDVCGSIANEMNDDLIDSFVSTIKKRDDGLTEHS